jgi:hypothetical protein
MFISQGPLCVVLRGYDEPWKAGNQQHTLAKAMHMTEHAFYNVFGFDVVLFVQFEILSVVVTMSLSVRYKAVYYVEWTASVV